VSSSADGVSRSTFRRTKPTGSPNAYRERALVNNGVKAYACFGISNIVGERR